MRNRTCQQDCSNSGRRCVRPPKLARPIFPISEAGSQAIRATQKGRWLGASLIVRDDCEEGALQVKPEESVFASGADLRSPFHRDDRQVPSATEELDVEREPITGLSGNERPRCRTR